MTYVIKLQQRSVLRTYLLLRLEDALFERVGVHATSAVGPDLDQVVDAQTQRRRAFRRAVVTLYRQTKISCCQT